MATLPQKRKIELIRGCYKYGATDKKVKKRLRRILLNNIAHTPDRYSVKWCESFLRIRYHPSVRKLI